MNWMRALLAVTLVALAGQAAAAEIEVKQPWARASLNPIGVVYLTLVNPSSEPGRLVGAETPVAAHVMLMTNSGGHRQMEAWDIPAGGRLEAKPAGDGLHIMLMDLTRKLSKGDAFPLTLRFANGDTQEVEVRVYGPGAMKPE